MISQPSPEMREPLRTYTISDSHWTGISCSCCNGTRAKRKKRTMVERALPLISEIKPCQRSDEHDQHASCK